MKTKAILVVEKENDEHYKVIVPEGSDALEVIFAMSIVAKVFDRDGVMSKEEILINLQRYLNDPQYEEVGEPC